MPNAHGSSIPQRWFHEYQPRNGLIASVYALVRDSPQARAAAVRALVEKYFMDAPHAALLSELGLSASPAETHGRSREQLRQELLAVAEHLHQELFAET